LNYSQQLSAEMNALLVKEGYTTPTPIQEKSLPVLMEKRDLIGIAQTGTGKTAAFVIPIIEHTFLNNNKTQTLVLCPTRELALQTTEVFRKFSANKKIRTVSVYGGQSASIQIRALRSGAQIVVGTPGRVKDLLSRNVLKLKNVRTIVLDEADEMLDFGFLPDIKTILSSVTGEHQTMLFSATMNREVAKVAEQFQRDPVRIEIGPRNEPTVMVMQSYLQTDESKKVSAVKNLLRQKQPRLALVFCNTRRRVKRLASALTDEGVSTSCLHGEMSQNERDNIMRTFRSADCAVLVATDVAARGLDVDKIDLVINYDVPDKPDYYVHRIGRTGRAGNTGKACTLICPAQKSWILDIERRFRIRLTREAAMTL